MTTKQNPVTAALLRMIMEGLIQPGEWIREADIAKQLGVSRTPVRDALRELIGTGVLTMEPNRGVRVRSYTNAHIEEIYRSRALVEPYVIAASIPHIAPEDIDQLTAMSAEMRKLSTDPERRTEVSELNRAFHRYFFEKVPDHPLSPTADNLMIPIIVSRIIVAYDPRAVSVSMDHHDELILAAETQDPEWASSIMRTHILSGLNNYKRSVKTDAEVASAPWELPAR